MTQAKSPLTIGACVRWMANVLSVDSDVPHLEAELLLAHVMQCDRARLIMCRDDVLSEPVLQHVTQLLDQRRRGVPIAYLLGEKEFWSLMFRVSSDTLVPRPETECLVAFIVNDHPAESSLSVWDVGTGSGAIAIALAVMRPHWQIRASDRSETALQVAKANAAHHGVAIAFSLADVYGHAAGDEVDVVVSNPPYLSEAEWQALPALHHEPKEALVSEDNGLAMIKALIHGAQRVLRVGGKVYIEHGYEQGEKVSALFHQSGNYDKIQTIKDQFGKNRFTFAILKRKTRT